MISRRNLAWFSLSGVLATALLALLGQTDPDPQLDPFQLTVSDYAVQDRGGATDKAMLVFGGSAFALMLALRPRRRVAVALLAFSIGMVVAAIAPTDFGTELSTVGYIHRYASMAAFIALPMAALLVRDLPLLRGIRWATMASAVFMMLMLMSATIGDRLLIGLVERVLLLSELVVLGLMAVGALRRLPVQSKMRPRHAAWPAPTTCA